jgi:hypothetical protein
VKTLIIMLLEISSGVACWNRLLQIADTICIFLNFFFLVGNKHYICSKVKCVVCCNTEHSQQQTCYSSLLAFVPKHSPTQDDIEKISTFINSANKLVVLTGAGILAESGIPDYHSEGVGLYARSKDQFSIKIL